MKSIIKDLLVVSALTIVLSVTAVIAADTSTVTATVTAQNISVTVTDGTVTYGTLALSGSNDTTSGNLDDSQTATNNGNITEDFNIQGQNTGTWTLAGSIGSDQYYHAFCTSTCDSTPTWNALTTSYQTLATGVAASGTQIFDLKITVPSTSSVYTSQSADVTVQAVQG